MVSKGHGATVGELYQDMFVAAAAAVAMSNVNVHMVMRIHDPPASFPKFSNCRPKSRNFLTVVVPKIQKGNSVRVKTKSNSITLFEESKKWAVRRVSSPNFLEKPQSHVVGRWSTRAWHRKKILQGGHIEI